MAGLAKLPWWPGWFSMRVWRFQAVSAAAIGAIEADDDGRGVLVFTGGRQIMYRTKAVDNVWL